MSSDPSGPNDPSNPSACDHSSGLDYLELWKYFQERADDIKEAMFRTITWTTGIAAALLAFMFTSLISFDPAKAKISHFVAALAAAVGGLIVCFYSVLALREARKHIQANWDRADFCEKHVRGLQTIIRGDGRKPRRKTIMPIWWQLGIVVALFAFAFVGLLVLTALVASPQRPNLLGSNPS
jgi:hypothetical protein